MEIAAELRDEVTLIALQIGLDGRLAPGAGLYFPETLLDADWVQAQLPNLRLLLAETA
jgi:hypothetical protein